MERFAFKIDEALKANLCKICRLCGIDNPQKVEILPEETEVVDLDEPSLSQKIFELVGFMTMCSLCMDKINDFYEFREMCHATNEQTRKLLGLKQAEPQRLDTNLMLKQEPVSISKRGRKRKIDETKTNRADLLLDVKTEPLGWRKKMRLQAKIKEEPKESFVAKQRGNRKVSCSVCGDRFDTKDKAEEHKLNVHVPMIPRYYCYACNQTHHNASDIKAHQLWHKLSKTPYKCHMCDSSLANNYAFTRHMREHTPKTALELLVLDRECPLCRRTFLTNFFYNTHPCARRTRKCGGCSRPLATDLAYMKHAPFCAKIYLNHTKHIMPEAAHNEAQMRIKNEYDVDIEDSAALSATVATEGEEMQPVVILERLGSPLLRAAAESNTLVRSTERISAKVYKRRVNELLKSTMSTLVSIKHEPEVHINDTGPQEEQDQEEEEEEEDDYEDQLDTTDFQTAADDSELSADETIAVAIKQEPSDDTYGQPLKLKLKITNNHGQLNSAIVAEDPELQSRANKKKKKRKHRERHRETQPPVETPTGNVTATDTETETVAIKQEQIEQEDVYPNTNMDFESQSNVMTSIPMLQLAGSLNEEREQQEESQQMESEDVKPNRQELDRLLQITHIASGVDMAKEVSSSLEPLPPQATGPEAETVRAPAPAEEVSPSLEALPPQATSPAPVVAEEVSPSLEPLPPQASSPAPVVAEEVSPSLETLSPQATATEPTPAQSPAEAPALSSGQAEAGTQTVRKPRTKHTARKSTMGLAHDGAVPLLPQIVNVASVSIKLEPQNRGYADEINHNEKFDEQAAYSNSLDLSNIVIKQEPDLHINDGIQLVQLPTNVVSQADYINNGGNDLPPTEDEAQHSMDTEETPIYKELELPPLETTIKEEPLEMASELEVSQSEEPDAACREGETEFNFIITNVYSQADEATSLENPEAGNALENIEHNLSTEEHIEEKTDEEHTEKKTNQEHTVETTDQEHTEQDTDQEHTDQKHTEQKHTEQNTDQEHTEQNSDQEHTEENTKQQSTADTLINQSEEASSCSAIVTLTVPKESETHAQPFFEEERDNTAIDDNCFEEEQQNVLNHELTVEEAALPTEETENRFNEQQQQNQQEEQQQPQQQPRCLDEANINEIAENNNNANIERELQDDALVAQDNAQPHIA
ncbi:CG1647 [Drosophila busckii]|uniref:CG1647 n=1 Tax=Drosophila busckii TaxID=30019 RepID=A0A0M5J9M0_DROBS|nr:CG1647 [Drosophila busckii]